MGRTNDDQVLSYAFCYERNTLPIDGLGMYKFHGFMLGGEPFADHYIDDKAISDGDFFKD